MPFVIPDAEKWAVGARQFLDYVTPHISPPGPSPDAAPLPPADADLGAPAMPEAQSVAPVAPTPPMAPPAMPPPVPESAPDQGGFAPVAGAGGFDPGSPPPPPDPAEQAAQFAAYTASHGIDVAPSTVPPAFAPDVSQRAFGAPEGDRPPSEFEPPSQFADEAQRFADYVGPDLIQTAGRLGRLAAPAMTGQYAQMGGPANQEDARVLGQQAVDVDEQRRASARRVTAALEAGDSAEAQRALAESPLIEVAMGVGGSGPQIAGQAAGTVAGAVGQEVARLRLDKFPEPVRDTIQAAVTAGDDFWRTQRRGVIPDQAAEQMADRLGRSVDQLIAGGKAGKAYTTEETRAIRNAVTAQAVKVSDLAEQIAQNPMVDDKRLIAEQVAEGMKLADLTRVAEGARAEAGRTLRAYTAFTRDFDANPVAAVQRIFRANNLTPEQATQKVAAFQQMTANGADAFAMAKFWANVEKPPPNAQEWFDLLRSNAMLSGPRTMMVNTLGTGAELPWRAMRDVGASVAKGRPEELVPEAIGIARGFERGLGAFFETMKHGITAEQAAAGDLPRSISSRLEPGLARKTALTLEFQGRVNQATDELYRQVFLGMAKGRFAALRAAEEGHRGKALLDRADYWFDNPTGGMLATAGAAADRMTYKGDLGPIARQVQHIQQIPILGRVLIPFFRTIVHITNRGIDRSPLGIVGTGIDLARGAYRAGKVPVGQAPLGERLADNALGLVGTAGLWYLAEQGLISGAGPQDPEIRDMMKAQGWQPYSVKIGGKWISYAQGGPFAIPLSLAAGVAEARRYAKPDQGADIIMLDAFRRSAQVLTEQPYLGGVGAIYKGMTDPGRYGERWVEGFLQTLVPEGALINTAGQVMDPVQREPRKGDILGSLATRFPGLREQQPARQDVLGRPMESEQTGAGAFLPTRQTTERPDPALSALLAAGLQVPDPPKDIRNVVLSPDEQRLYQRLAGEALSKRVGELDTDDPSWADLTPARRKTLLEDAVTRARKTAATETERAIGASAWHERQLEAERKKRG